jgi:hypothetical protein
LFQKVSFFMLRKDVEMPSHVSQGTEDSFVDINAIAGFIAGIQKKSGEIPCSEGGDTKPWNHVESAMGLSAAGHLRDAERAYDWMKSSQLPDGSWYATYRDEYPEDKTRDSNVSSYVAVGAFHHYLITGDEKFLKHMWKTVEAGIEYAVAMQASSGVVYWAKNDAGIVDPMALLTASSSVYFSLKCALSIAMKLDQEKIHWQNALKKLGIAIKNRPHLFNETKSRFAMDWYYPVLCGAVTRKAARLRLNKSWDKFVVPGWGVRCVADRPWTTIAETSELVLTLASINEHERAELLFNWITDKKYDDGSYWMGVTFPNSIVWPADKTTWTAAAVIIAFDALSSLTPACNLFSHRFWSETGLWLPHVLKSSFPYPTDMEEECLEEGSPALFDQSF